MKKHAELPFTPTTATAPAVPTVPAVPPDPAVPPAPATPVAQTPGEDPNVAGKAIVDQGELGTLNKLKHDWHVLLTTTITAATYILEIPVVKAHTTAPIWGLARSLASRVWAAVRGKATAEAAKDTAVLVGEKAVGLTLGTIFTCATSFIDGFQIGSAIAPYVFGDMNNYITMSTALLKLLDSETEASSWNNLSISTSKPYMADQDKTTYETFNEISNAVVPATRVLDWGARQMGINPDPDKRSSLKIRNYKKADDDLSTMKEKALIEEMGRYRLAISMSTYGLAKSQEKHFDGGMKVLSDPTPPLNDPEATQKHVILVQRAMKDIQTCVDACDALASEPFKLRYLEVHNVKNYNVSLGPFKNVELNPFSRSLVDIQKFAENISEELKKAAGNSVDYIIRAQVCSEELLKGIDEMLEAGLAPAIKKEQSYIIKQYIKVAKILSIYNKA